MLTIKVLGPGCANCRKVEEIVRETAAGLGVQVDVVKVTDATEIVEHGVLRTPGLWIEGRLVSSGRVPAPATVAAWIRERSG